MKIRDLRKFLSITSKEIRRYNFEEIGRYETIKKYFEENFERRKDNLEYLNLILLDLEKKETDETKYLFSEYSQYMLEENSLSSLKKNQKPKLSKKDLQKTFKTKEYFSQLNKLKKDFEKILDSLK